MCVGEAEAPVIPEHRVSQFIIIIILVFLYTYFYDCVTYGHFLYNMCMCACNYSKQNAS